MSWILAILCTIMVLNCVMMYRNSYVVYKHRTTALAIISSKSKEMIENSDFEWLELYDKYDEYGTYCQMLFDLTKWKFEHFYPGLEDL